jgi:protein-tyrosine phosphatase
VIRSVLKAALPRGFVQTARDLVRVESGARGTFLLLALRRRLGRDRDPVLPTARSISLVMICHGNILRSAYAAALLKQAVLAARIPEVRVSSAGLHAMPGKAADPRGIEAARESGIDLGAHRATMLDARIVDSADLLVVMDHLNVAELVSRYPRAAHKVVLLGAFDPAGPQDPAIPDPYMGNRDAVRASYRRVASAVQGLVARLSAL